jgi:antitoxin component YwqK of YwqJK toxin-antitoxin module
MLIINYFHFPKRPPFPFPPREKGFTFCSFPPEGRLGRGFIMNLKIASIALLLAISSIALCQSASELNKTDQLGRKQGHWIKKYTNEIVMYDGFFKDDNPVGEFRRYYENKVLKSLLIYSADSKEALASIYHSNGFISSKGKYINQLKEGKWQFFSISINGYLICEESYSKNLRNGMSFKFYPDSTVAERLSFVNDKRQGEWIQYYPNGEVCLKSSFLNDKVNGKFDVWFENGKMEFSGQYNNDVRDGLWQIYNTDGTVKYKLEYVGGVSKNRQMDIDGSEYLDQLEKNKGKIPDPEKTGVIQP